MMAIYHDCNHCIHFPYITKSNDQICIIYLPLLEKRATITRLHGTKTRQSRNISRRYTFQIGRLNVTEDHQNIINEVTLHHAKYNLSFEVEVYGDRNKWFLTTLVKLKSYCLLGSYSLVCVRRNILVTLLK